MTNFAVGRHENLEACSFGGPESVAVRELSQPRSQPLPTGSSDATPRGTPLSKSACISAQVRGLPDSGRRTPSTALTCFRA